MEKIQRMLNFDIQRDSTEDGQKKISGRPIVYGAIADIGDFFEVIEQGALNETDMKDVPLLVNHDNKMIPLARSTFRTLSQAEYPRFPGLLSLPDASTVRST